MFIENLLSENQKNLIKQNLLNYEFKWRWVENYNLSDGLNFLTSPVCNDKIVFNKEAYNLCICILEEFQKRYNLNIKNLVRIRINLFFPITKQIDDNMIELMVHKDFDGYPKNDMYSLIYFVNESDGDLLVFDDSKKEIKKRFSPKENSACVIKSNDWHTPIPPVENKKRVSVVFIFISDEELL